MAKILIYTQAYNTEKYIEQCIQSVLMQTFTNFEYILVDNGSIDKTGNIIDKYAKKDSRIKKIRFEENRKGILPKYIKERAEGEYFTTLDSDDWLEPTFLETMYNYAKEEDIDIVACGTCFHFLATNKLGYRNSNIKMSIEKIGFTEYFRVFHQFFRPIWGKLFKISILKNANFKECDLVSNMGGYGADTVFSMAALDISNKIGISEKVLHNYRVHNKSASYIYNTNRFYSDIFLFHNAENFLESLGIISAENYCFIYLVYLNAIKDTLNIVINADLSIHEKLYEIRNILKDQLTQQMFEFLCNNDKLEMFKQSILEVLLKFGKLGLIDNKIVNLVYKNICLLYKNFSKYIYEVDMADNMIDTGFIIDIINLDNRDITFSDNILLSWVKNKDFILKYIDIIKDIYFNRNDEALNKIINVITCGDAILYEEDIMFLCLNIAAKLEDSAVFVYAKKLQAELFIQQKRYDEAKIFLKDLQDMCPNDEDVIQLRNWMEEENE